MDYVMYIRNPRAVMMQDETVVRIMLNNEIVYTSGTYVKGNISFDYGILKVVDARCVIIENNSMETVTVYMDGDSENAVTFQNVLKLELENVDVLKFYHTGFESPEIVNYDVDAAQLYFRNRCGLSYLKDTIYKYSKSSNLSNMFEGAEIIWDPSKEDEVKLPIEEHENPMDGILYGWVIGSTIDISYIENKNNIKITSLSSMFKDAKLFHNIIYEDSTNIYCLEIKGDPNKDSDIVDFSNMFNNFGNNYSSTSCSLGMIRFYDIRNREISNFKGFLDNSAIYSLSITNCDFKPSEPIICENCQVGRSIKISNSNLEPLKGIIKSVERLKRPLLSNPLPVQLVIDSCNDFGECKDFFNDCRTYFRITISNMYTSSSDLSYMFKGANAGVELENFNAQNATNLDYMFANLNISVLSVEDYYFSLDGFTAGKVTTMKGIFYATNGEGLVLNVSGINTSNTTDMSYAFSYCDTRFSGISSWDVSNVENMSYMFKSYQYPIDFISNWDTGNVKDMSHMFERYYFDRDLPSIRVLENLNTNSVTNMRAMFKESDIKLRLDYDIPPYYNEEIDIYLNWNVSNVTNMSEMFQHFGNYLYTSGYPSKIRLHLESWNINKVTEYTDMFSGVLPSRVEIHIPGTGRWNKTEADLGFSGTFVRH